MKTAIWTQSNGRQLMVFVYLEKNLRKENQAMW